MPFSPSPASPITWRRPGARTHLLHKMSAMGLLGRWRENFACAFLFFYLTLAAVDNPQTVYSLTIFSKQKPCATSCFVYYGHCQSDHVAFALQCSTSYCVPDLGALDSCYCRPDSQPVAESFLSSCILESCTAGSPTVDASSAVSIYRSYCSSKGYPATALGVATTSSSPISLTPG